MWSTMVIPVPAEWGGRVAGCGPRAGTEICPYVTRSLRAPQSCIRRGEPGPGKMTSGRIRAGYGLQEGWGELAI